MISGKSFSERCNWVIDPRYPEREAFRYSVAQNGDWVFVNGDYLHELQRRLPFLSTKRFIFVIHNTDKSFVNTSILTHALRVYTVNIGIRHPLVFPIPLGFVDKQLPLLPGFKGGSSERTIEVYMNFLDCTNNQKRTECREALKDDPRVTRAEGLTVPEYFIDLGRSKFVVCPEGTGVDTHRVYESLFCGATPVVLHSSLDILYEKLPVCIVDRWTDPYTVPEGKSFNQDITSYL